jgi:hypothetical protein
VRHDLPLLRRRTHSSAAARLRAARSRQPLSAETCAQPRLYGLRTTRMGAAARRAEAAGNGKKKGCRTQATIRHTTKQPQPRTQAQAQTPPAKMPTQPRARAHAHAAVSERSSGGPGRRDLHAAEARHRVGVDTHLCAGETHRRDDGL